MVTLFNCPIFIMGKTTHYKCGLKIFLKLYISSKICEPSLQFSLGKKKFLFVSHIIRYE